MATTESDSTQQGVSQHDSAQREQYYVISVAAELTGMHAQTLRTYDRMGLVTPMRTRGGGRRYSSRDIATLRWIQQLSQDEGVNLAGIKTIIELTERIESLEGELASKQSEVERLLERVRSDAIGSPTSPAEGTVGTGTSAGAVAVRTGTELVHVPRSTSVVLWESGARRRRRER